MATNPDPVDLRSAPAGTGWKRQPLALWLFLGIGAGRIILTGIGLVLFRGKK